MKKIILFFCMFFLLYSTAYAAPDVDSVSGALTHGGSVTITGTGFGAKATPAPTLFDDGEDKTIDSYAAVLTSGGGPYTYARPNQATPSDANIQYRTAPYRSTPAPHSKSTKYLVGGHALNPTGRPCTSFSDRAGADVLVLHPVTDVDGTVYATWWERLDPLFPDDGTETGGQDNYKYFFFESHSDNYVAPHFYLNDNSNDTPQKKLGYSSARYMGGVEESCTWEEWPGNYTDSLRHDSPVDGWIKREVIGYKGHSSSEGYIKEWVNNKLALAPTPFYSGIPDGRTCSWWDSIVGGTLSGITVGGFWRDEACLNPPLGVAEGNANAWRYMDDIYIDTTVSRVMLCSSSTYPTTNASKCEPQPPTAWSASSIIVTVNQGALPDGKAYLFVFDSANASNATGLEVTLGTTPPSAQGCTISGGTFK